MSDDMTACSSPGGAGADAEAQQRQQDELGSASDDRLQMDGLDLPSLAGAKGTGPRLFCGHVPKEVNDEMVRQHFSKWGTVNDVYFPRHKKTLKRRPFCFVTFANKEDAERALAESGLEIAGVAIKNLTMVEDRDKYYTHKHATARQALLQALKQLGPSPSASVPNGSNGTTSLPATSNGSSNGGGGSVPADQLSNLAAIMALEGVPADIVLQTLGLQGIAPEQPTPTSSAMAAAAAAAAGLAAPSLDSATLLQALASPSLSTSSTFDLRSSFDLRNSFDLTAAAIRSARNSLDLSQFHPGLAGAAAGALPFDAVAAAGRLPTTDSRSTLASADWSSAPSVRTSMDAAYLPAATAGFLVGQSVSPLGTLPTGPNGLGAANLQTRMSLDAALQLQQAQQQAAMMVNASAARMSVQLPYHGPSGLPPPAPQPNLGPQHNLASVMGSSFYQGGGSPAAPPPAPQPQPEPVQHSLHTVMSSGFYGGGSGGGAPPAPAPMARHSICDFSSATTSSLPFADAAWASQQQQGQGQGHTLGGYSVAMAMRPSIDRSGLPPLPPRSPNQDGLGQRSGSGSPDTLLGLSTARWPLATQRLAA